MKVFLVIILVLIICIPVIMLISVVRALCFVREGKTYAKEKFWDTFLSFFLELLNPMNWFL